MAERTTALVDAFIRKLRAFSVLCAVNIAVRPYQMLPNDDSHAGQQPQRA